MAKSFKRVIACLLAVLMVAFSAPISAMAYIPEGVKPDIDVQFSTYYNTNDGLWNTPGSAKADASFDYCGLWDAPIKATREKDTTTGSLKISKLELTQDMTAGMASVLGVDPVDYTYTVGDMFLMTVVVKDVEEFNYVEAAIQYSDNIEPAGLYSYKNGRKTEYAWGSETERAAANQGAWLNGGTTDAGVLKQSGPTIYGANFENRFAEMHADENYFKVEANPANGAPTNDFATAASSDPDVPFVDPETGNADGYTYNDRIIIMSYAFKIVGEVSAANPIVLSPYDPTNQHFTMSGEGCKYSAHGPNDSDMIVYCTDSQFGAPGTMLMFGMNINTGEGCEGGDTPQVTHTVTYVDAEGATLSTETVNDGAAPASVPTLPANTAHDSYAWDGDVTAAITADTTFTIVKTTSAHDYVGVTTPATCTEDGYTTYTCSICGDSYTEPGDPATGHAYGAWVDFDATNHAKTCANCGDVIYEAHIAGEAVTEAGVAPTATEDGYHYEVVSCTVCGRELSRTQVTDPALGEDYNFSAFVIDTANETAVARFVGAVTGTVDDREATVSKSVTPATCTADGSTVYTAAYDGVTATAENGGIVTITESALGHDMGEWEVITPASCTEKGTEARSCSRCDFVETRDIELTEHDYNAVETPATCTEDGYTTYTCANCGDTYTVAGEKAKGHTMTPYAAVPATCLEDGSEAYWICSVCNKMFSDANGENEIANPITIDALGHDMGEWVVTKEATKQAAGEKTRSCSRCDYVETEVIPALGIAVTVTNAEGGSVTGSVASGETVDTFKFGDTITLNAVPASGYEFTGWKINGKNVSKAEVYTSRVFADVTIEPVFSKSEVESFTVVFYDIFKNVVSTQTVSSAAELEVPSDATMARNGFTFKGWDIDPATVTKATEITGLYDADQSLGYTVTVEGADASITKINGEATTSADGIFYDSKVTVTVEGATGFKIGDTVVSTSDSYTFYVGADVTVTAVFDDVATVNAIDIISVTPVSGTDYKYQFLATRTVADGYKVEKVGFVYGKNLEDSELDLEKAGQTSAAGTKIKVGYNNFTASVLETSLQYGLTGKTGTIKAKAFMVVSKGGKSEVIYSTIKGYNYQGGYINVLGDEEP